VTTATAKLASLCERCY